MRKTITLLFFLSSFLNFGQGIKTVKEMPDFYPLPNWISPLSVNGKILQYMSCGAFDLSSKEGAENQKSKTIQLDQNRKEKLKSIEVGDMICATEVYHLRTKIQNTYGSKFIPRNEFFIVEIKAFVEQKSKNKIQIKIVDKTCKFEQYREEMKTTGYEEVFAESSYSLENMPFLCKGVKIVKDKIFWIDPINDYRWYNCN